MEGGPGRPGPPVSRAGHLPLPLRNPFANGTMETGFPGKGSRHAAEGRWRKADAL
jgi:hypothetical protein